MAMTLHLDIVSAETEIYSGPAEMVFAPAVGGEMGILPRHTPVLTFLRPGEVRIRKPGGEEEHIYVSGGVLEVQPHMVTVLSDTAMRAHDIDESAAQEAKQRAEQILRDKTSSFEYAEAEKELAQAVAQLAALQNLRKKRGR